MVDMYRLNADRFNINSNHGNTQVMQICHEYLVEKKKAPKEKMEFMKLLYKLWFQTYRRTREDK